MSVPKSRRGESPAEYINLAREIYVFTYNRVRILPKSYTFYFSLPLYNAAREAYRMIKTAIIERAVAALELDNEAALECVELFPAWENGKAYTVETRVQYGGKLYRCVQAHTSQSDWTPPVAASLWSGVTVAPATGYDEWKQPTGAHDAYKKGDRVLFNGSVYESLIDGNAYSPTAYPAGWKLIE